MDFKIICTPVGSYQANCYFLYNDKNEAIIIDPGAEAKNIVDFVKERGFRVSKILLTHAHPDHFGAMREVRKALNVPAYISEKDEVLMEDRCQTVMNSLLDLGVTMNDVKADVLFKDGDEIPFGDKKIKVILTPGHTPGGACFMIDNVLFTGDTLFRGSIGRTDLPGGDYSKIMDSLKKLMTLPDSTIVLPGHGGETTIGLEKQINPFVQQIL